MEQRWCSIWMILAGLTIAFLAAMAIVTAEELRDIEGRLDHIDTHFQAPEPTPRQHGVVT